MKEAIRQRALDLGFDDCRFTSANPPDHAAQFQNWIVEKRHGEMNWLERNAEKRIQPQRVLDGAKSIITLAVSYETRDKCQVTNDAKADIDSCHPSLITRHNGIIARYAHFTDYHDVLAERLKTLTTFVNECGGAAARSLWYVDTGPILERDFAQRAGLGFIGKHTNVISRNLGNWIFLAEIITTIEFKPDRPEKNHCGSCTRCIAACPTNAIIAPFQLDARRCISYLTIELKSAIPVELRRAIGNRIYGCDDCLAVCPWNKFAREGRMMRPYLRTDLTTPDLSELLSLNEAGFKKRFAHSPILRTKRRGFLRNVCVALGNVGDNSALSALEKAKSDPETLIAEHAQWAISEIKSRQKDG